MSVEVVIFDFDGTLVDTETCSFDSWQQVLAEHGCELPVDLWELYVGTTDRTVWHPLDTLEAHLGRTVDRVALTAYRNELRADILPTLQLEPGARVLLDSLEERGVRLGIASSSETAWVTGHLDRLAIRSRFEVICCREDVSKPKPDPALYRLVLDRMHISKHEAVAVEDSPNGAKAALAAGLRTVVVPNGVTRRYSFPSAVEHYPTLADLPLDHLLGRTGP